MLVSSLGMATNGITMRQRVVPLTATDVMQALFIPAAEPRLLDRMYAVRTADAISLLSTILKCGLL
jgi:hypothetical protein